MKKYFQLIFLCLGFLAFAQKTEIKVSVSITSGSLAELITEIETQTGLRFFMQEDWKNSPIPNKVFDQVNLVEVLDFYLSNTSFNYYISPDNRVILTQNNRIYTELPDGFFKSVRTSVYDEQQNRAPVFVTNQTQQSPIETIRVGKERKTTTKQLVTISGKIVNAETKQPIADVAVVNTTNGNGTVSNANGYYELKIPVGVHVLETSALGLSEERKRVIAFDSGTVNFSISDSFEMLDEVVLRGNATQNIEDTSTGNNRIGSEESKNIPLVLGERDVLKVATTLPGVTTAGEGAAGFNVRGGKTDQNLILLDDAVVYNPSHFFGIFQALNPFAIEEVSIYKGSIPAEYGGRLSSVFDITTKDVSTSKFTGEASVGPVTANAVVQIPIVENKSGLLLGGRAAYSDWVLSALNDTSLKETGASFYDAILKYQHQIDQNNDLRVSAYYSKDAFNITRDSLYSYANALASIKWNHQFNANTTGNLILAKSRYNFDIDVTTDDNFTQRFQIDETELKAQVQQKLSAKHTINYGASAKLYQVVPGELIPQGANNLLQEIKIPEERALESALFLSDNITISEKLMLDLGMRYSFYAALGPASQRTYANGQPKSNVSVLDTLTYDKNKVFQTYGGPEFRAAARYKIAEDLSIKASVNSMYQFIHTLSNTTTVSPIDTWKLSDRNIKPQQALQVAVGVYKNIDIDAYELSLEGFYKKQQDIIDFKTGAKLLLNEHIETEVLQGEGKAYGVELLIRKNKGRVNGWLGYTYSRSLFKLDSDFEQERVNNGGFFPSNFDKPHDISMVLNYKFNKRISLSSNFVYQTGRPVTFPIGNYQFNNAEYVLYSNRNQFRIPDYYRLDLGLNFEGNHKKNKKIHGFWSLSVYNVLGRNNPYSVFFVNTDGEIQALQSSIFAVPVPSLTYNIKF